MKYLKLTKKHYKRMKGFLFYDIEEREIQEQIIILEQTINAATKLLEKIKNKNEK